MEDWYLGRLTPGMDVCDSNGDKLGSVAHVYRHDPAQVSMAGGPGRLPQAEVVEVKTGFLGLGRHLFIPIGVIAEVTQGGVFLSKPADEIKQNDEWHYKPSYLDELH